jgi:DeoR/GlpR family transcriptional regulator of sugar metabolism
MEGMKSLFPEERRIEIIKRIQGAGRVAVTELSQEFGVSEVTIRTDLQVLVDQDWVVRTHGGAVLANRIPDTSLALRRQLQVSEKEKIGAASAAMVLNGDAVFLDSSSTALAMARYLNPYRELTVFTNSLAVAQVLLDATGVTVVMPGGALRRDTISLIGDDGLDFFRRYNIKKGFFGAHGISLREGLTDVSKAEADLKQHMVKMCSEVIALLDATKWGQVGLASFARIEELNSIITDAMAPAGLIEQVKTSGVKVIIV